MLFELLAGETLQRLVAQRCNGCGGGGIRGYIRHLYYYVLERRGGGECA